MSKVAYSGKGNAMAVRRYPRKRETNNVVEKKEEKLDPVKPENEDIKEETEKHEDTSHDTGLTETEDANEYNEDHTKEDSHPPDPDQGSCEPVYEEPVRSSYDEPGYTGEEESIKSNSEHYGGQDITTENEATNEDYSHYDAPEKVSDEDFVQRKDYSSDSINHDMNDETPGECAEVTEGEEVQEVSESGLDDFYANLG